MKLSSLQSSETSRLLCGDGLRLTLGTFNVCLHSFLPHVSKSLEFFYADYDLFSKDDFVDYSVEINSPSLLRKWIRPQVNFCFDGHFPFKPLPKAQSFAMFEWGLNWVIANHAHQFLVIHAAVVERDGKAIIFPGTPGSGKSTLCAALVTRGWRLLSDEMALISKEDGLIYPIPRPISLKNDSIAVIRNFSKNVVIGDVVENTAKGSVAHMRVPASSLTVSKRAARPACIIFPKYQTDAELSLKPLSRGQALLQVAENSFNYNVTGLAGFELLANTIDHCRCFTFSYQHLDDAISTMDQVMRDDQPA